MNLELEVKSRCHNLAKVRSQLKRLGAKFIGQVHQVDTYYQISPDYYLNRRPKLRIREEKNKRQVFLEYHVPINAFKAKEFETSLGDAKIGRVILEKLGYRVGLVVDKKREKYRMGKINIDLDQLRGLGNFIEVEIMNNATRQSLKMIYQFLEKLGISKSDNIAGQSYVNLLWQKKNK